MDLLHIYRIYTYLGFTPAKFTWNCHTSGHIHLENQETPCFTFRGFIISIQFFIVSILVKTVFNMFCLNYDIYNAFLDLSYLNLRHACSNPLCRYMISRGGGIRSFQLIICPSYTPWPYLGDGGATLLDADPIGIPEQLGLCDNYPTIISQLSRGHSISENAWDHTPTHFEVPYFDDGAHQKPRFFLGIRVVGWTSARYQVQFPDSFAHAMSGKAMMETSGMTTARNGILGATGGWQKVQQNHAQSMGGLWMVYGCRIFVYLSVWSLRIITGS